MILEKDGFSNMKLLISKSELNSFMNREFIRKSEEEENAKLAYFKKELLKILANKKDDEEESVDKSLLMYDSMLEKSGRGLPPGTKKEWPAGSGKWYVKNGKGEWVRTYNGNGRGSAKGMAMSVARMKKAIANANSVEELMSIVERNRYKFTDDEGHQLPIVKELMDHVHEKHSGIKGTSKPAAAVNVPKTENKAPETPVVSDKEKDRYHDQASYAMSDAINGAKKIDDYKAGKEQLQKRVDQWKDLIEYNKKAIADGKDTDGRLAKYNEHYKVQIAEFEKQIQFIQDYYIDPLQKKKDAAKAKREAKKAEKEKTGNKIDQDATKYGFKADDFSKRGYEIVDEYKGRAILKNKKTGNFAVAGNINGHLSLSPSWHSTTIDQVKESVDKNDKFAEERSVKKEQNKKAENKKKETNKLLKDIPVRQKEYVSELLNVLKEKEVGYNVGSYNNNKTTQYYARKDKTGYTVKITNLTDNTMKEYHLSEENAKNDDENSENNQGNSETENKTYSRESLLEEGLKDPSLKIIHDQEVDAIVNHSPYTDSWKSVKDSERLHIAEEMIGNYEENLKGATEKLNELAKDKKNNSDSWIKDNAYSLKKELVLLHAVKEGYNKLKQKIEESEAEKHENRSNAMKGNQNARKYGLSEDQEKELGDSVETWTEKEMADHVKAGDFGDEIRNGMEQAAKDQGISVDTLVADLHREYTEKKRKEYAEKLPEMIKNKAEEYKKDWYVKSSAERIVKKLGEKKLEIYAAMKIKDDDEFLKDITAKCQKLEMEGKHIDEYTYGTAVWNHFISKECQRLAKEKIDAIHENKTDSGEDIPVKEEDMKEAISIIGSDVDRILSGRDVYGNAKQTLTDKIKRRIRNQPALARAMLVYIQQQQKETGKTVYTPKHSIWMELPKLNENARNAKANGETETKTGTSGNLYEGDDGTYVVENKDWGRYQIFFPGKPDYTVISKLKSRGFRWSPKSGSWVCYNTGNGEYQLKQMVNELGLKKPVEKAPAPKDETPKEIEKELKKTPTFEDIKTKYQAAKSVTGNSKTYRLPNGEKIKCHYKLVEADAPTASHDENTYQKTPGFPTDDSGSTVNDRDYSKDVDAQLSVRNIAANYSGLAIQDPPIVTKDGIVVSGNNRTMSSKLAAKNGTDKQYLEDLKEEIEDYGIDPDELKNFDHPRLILEQDEEHTGKYTTEEFAKYNQEGKKSMNTTEKAVKISKTIKPEVVQNIAGTLSDYETMAEMWQDKQAAQKVISTLVNGGVIGQNDVSQYFTESAGISEAGKEFVETVLIGSVMNENNIRSLAGDGGKAIRQKLVRGIVPLIDNKGLGTEYSFNGELNEAVRIAVAVMKDREHFSSVKDYLDQGNMFEEKASPITGKLAEMIEGMTQKEFAEKMRSLNAGLRPAANGEMDMFLGRCETKEEVMNAFLKIKDTVQKAISGFMKLFA